MYIERVIYLERVPKTTYFCSGSMWGLNYTISGEVGTALLN